MVRRGIFTSESVSNGHPDKACDAISDAIVAACLEQDPTSRVACETMVKDDFVILAGEITTQAIIDVESIVKETYKKIGYDIKPRVLNLLQKQSPDIAMGTNEEVGGAGDQGMMFGYANSETSEYFPLAISVAHKLLEVATSQRVSGEFKWAKQDMKSQVSINYDTDPVTVDTVLMSVQHDAEYDDTEFKNYIKENIIKPVLEGFNLNTDCKVLINPTGRFVIGGPIGDSGVTGRKIIVDTYGGYAPHGGGAFSGKDTTKVDRSAAYMARYIAKNVVAAGLAKECSLELSYAIGIAEPISVVVDTCGTGVVSDARLEEVIREVFPLTPKGIIKELDLRNPDNMLVDQFGHFGRSVVTINTGKTVIVPWEKIDKIDALNGAIAESSN